MDRKEQIIELREKRVSFGEIGKILDISRQRVYQISQNNANKKSDEVRRIEKLAKVRDGYKCQWAEKCNGKYDNKLIDSKLIIHHIDFDESNDSLENLITLCISCHINKENNTPKPVAKYIKRNCERCNVEFEVSENRLKRNGCKYCSKYCYLEIVKHNRTPKEIKERNAEKTIKYYHKHKNDEGAKEKIKEINQKAYKIIKANPEKWKKFLKKQSEYYKKRRENKL